MSNFVDNSLFHQKCPICDSNNIGKLGDLPSRSPNYYSSISISMKRRSELWECNTCKSWFSQYVIPENKSIQLYSEGESSKIWDKDSFTESRSEDSVKIIRRYLSKGKNILDIGCCNGCFLDFAKSHGCNTYGIEYSKECSHILQEKGHTVLSSIKESNILYDVITAFDLIEHIYDFKTFMQECKDRLKPDGVLIIITGDKNSKEALQEKEKWWYVNYPEHIIFPSINTYEKLGFTVKYAKSIYPWFNRKFTIRRLLRKIVLLFTLDHIGYPFRSPNHYIVILSYTS